MNTEAALRYHRPPRQNELGNNAITGSRPYPGDKRRPLGYGRRLLP